MFPMFSRLLCGERHPTTDFVLRTSHRISNYETSNLNDCFFGVLNKELQIYKMFVCLGIEAGCCMIHGMYK